MAEGPSVAGRRRRACVNCTTNKSKCTPFSTDECERCHRLEKECFYAEISTTRRRPIANRRLQTLEQRVDELFAQRASHLTAPQTPALTDPPSGEASSSTTSGAFSWHNFVDTSSSSGFIVDTGHPYNQSTRGSNTTDGEIGDIVGRGLVTLESAQILLNRFRNSATQQFPFVMIPPRTTLDLLRRDTPLLFKIVMATMMYDNPSLQHQLGEEVRYRAFQRILIGCEKSLELLQSLLIYAAWYFYFYQDDKQHVFLISQLCVTLVYDLGLEKMRSKHMDLDMQHSGKELSSPLSHAQMRAYLGTYCLSCSVASSLRRRSAMAHTKYTERCYQTLAAAREYPTDDLLQHFVQSQELARRIFDSFSYDDVKTSEIQGEFIITLTADAFLRDLDRLRLLPTSTLRQNVAVALEFHVLNIMINEVAFHDELWNVTNGSFSASDATSHSVARSRMLWNSLKSCKAFIETFLSLPNADLFFLSAFTFSKLCYVFITLAKLVQTDLDVTDEGASQPTTGLRVPDTEYSQWHRTTIAKEANFSFLAGQVLKKFTGVATDFVNAKGKRDAMWNLASMIRIITSAHDRQMMEKQKTFSSAGAWAKEPDLRHDRRATAINPASYSNQATGSSGSDDIYGASSLDQSADLNWVSSDYMAWDQIFENFTMMPMP